MSILIVNVNKDKLLKGQCLYVALRKVPNVHKVTDLVFWDNTYVYGSPKLFGISRDKCELIQLFSQEELGLTPQKKHRLLKHKGAEGTWINWDYPVMFKKKVRLNTEKVNGFRIATEEEEKLIERELKRCQEQTM